MTEMVFTVKETAAILKCNLALVHSLRKSGQLKFMKLGSYKVRKSEIERFLKEMEGMDVSDPYNIKPLIIDSEETEEEEED